jgi:short-subunit dehydrogenase
MESQLSDAHKPFPPATPLHPRRRGIIVGASSGIGAALARRLAAEGYSLALVARREDSLKKISAEINAAAGETRALPYVHDVTNYAAVPDLLRKITSDLGGLDLLVFASGVNFPPGLENYDFESDRKMIEVNLLGAQAWLSPVAAMFQSARAGQIVGISSVAGDRGRVGNPGYNTSKAALTTYLEALRNRLTRHGVNVLTIKPGFVETEMLKAAQGKTPFVISADKAAGDIWNAMRKRRQMIYTPFLWRWIMLTIQHIPSFIFRRMSF